MRASSTPATARAAISLAAMVVTLLLPAVAASQPSHAEEAAAQELFDQARRLIEVGKFSEACPKFEASQRLDPGAGTLLNLASCNERIGKIATAWTQYNEALSLAIRDERRDRISYARAHIIAVEPRLPRLTVRVEAPETVGLSVVVDGATLREVAWGVAAPIDPGDHVVEARAPGRLPFSETVTLVPAQAARVDVPALAEEPEPVAPPTHAPGTRSPIEPAATPPRPPDNARRIAAGISFGAGALALGAGAYFGARATSAWSDANASCSHDVCSPRGEALTSDAQTAARVADVCLAIGGAGVVVGAVVLLTPGHTAGAPSAVHVALVPSELGGRLLLNGAW